MLSVEQKAQVFFSATEPDAKKPAQERLKRMSFAQITLIGYLGRDPEMTYTAKGVALTKFSVAVNRRMGEKEETTWYNCAAWRGLAETLYAHLKKGEQVFIQGELSVHSYTTKDGRQGSSLEINVDKFQFLGGKPQSGVTAGIATDTSAAGNDLNEPPF